MTKIGYYLLFAFSYLISLIPFWLLYRISDILFVINYYIIGYRKKVVFSNLRRVFPDKPEKEIAKLAKSFYRHFCDFLLELVKTISIPMTSLGKRMIFTNPELFGDLAAENRSFALVAAHYNNWEWFNILPTKMAHAFIAIYRPLNSKSMDKLSRAIRARYNPVLVPMEGVFREAVNTRNRNQLFSIFFLADQRPPRKNRYWTTFLGQEASFFEGVEKLSRKLELAVVFMDMRKTGRGKYELTLKKLFNNAAETLENEVMQACIREMENEILAAPQYWLWSHNRFKHTRPENYNLIER